jgi:hypothetical protein
MAACLGSNEDAVDDGTPRPNWVLTTKIYGSKCMHCGDYWMPMNDLYYDFLAGCGNDGEFNSQEFLAPAVYGYKPLALFRESYNLLTLFPSSKLM